MLLGLSPRLFLMLQLLLKHWDPGVSILNSPLLTCFSPVVYTLTCTTFMTSTCPDLSPEFSTPGEVDVFI